MSELELEIEYLAESVGYNAEQSYNEDAIVYGESE